MKKILILMLIMVIGFTNVFAQSKTGSIKGSVQNNKQKPLAGLTVQLLNINKITQTNDEGEFEINNVAEGTYTLSVSGVGFSVKKQDVQVSSSKRITLTLQLSEDEKVLTEVVVTGRVKGYAQTEISPTTRLNAPNLEVSQNIVSVTGALLKDQQQTDIQGLLGNVSGLSQNTPNPFLRADFFIRGTLADNNKVRNGIGGFAMEPMEDAAIIDHVEFIKGPAGFMMSNAEPGGIINIVTKPAVKTNLFEANVMIGGYQFFRASADMGSSITKDKKLYYRLNLAAQNQMTATDYYGFKRYTIAPVLTYDINEKTTLTAEYNYTHGISIGSTDPSMPGINDKYWVLPNNFSATADFTVPDGFATSHLIRLNLQHKISDNWKLTTQLASYNDERLDYNLYGGYSKSDVDSLNNYGILNRHLDLWHTKQQNTVIQFFLNGDFNTGTAIKHNVLFGIDKANVRYGVIDGDAKDMSLDINNSNYGVPFDTLTAGFQPATQFNWNKYGSSYSWTGFYLQDNIKFFDRIILTFAGRYTSYQQPQSNEVEKSGAFTPRGGITVLINKNISLYGLYDQAFLAQSGRAYNGSRFKPLLGNNIEFGFKSQWFDNRLITNISYYNILKNNVLTPDPLHPNFSLQLGKQTSSGLELDVIGQVLPQLNIVANYAYTDSKTLSSDGTFSYPTKGVPLHNANCWVKYSPINGIFKGLGIGAGVNAVYKRPATYEERPATYLPDYQLINAALSYKINNTTFALNVTNVFNQRYIPGGGHYDFGGYDVWLYLPSNPTDYRLSINYKF
jgi:iron complex outermembrane recepter protein